MWTRRRAVRSPSLTSDWSPRVFVLLIYILGYCGDRFIRLKNIPPGHVARRAYVPTSQDDESDEEI